MKRYRILVFPCGSEIGLEVYRSLRYSTHIELIGANSVDDHGRFIYENYIGDLPFIESDDFVTHLKKIIKDNQIDAIYPAMDKVIWKLKINEEKLGCKVISSPAETTEICLSKTNTYNLFRDIIKVPVVYTSVNSINQYPVFVKPDIGYGTRGIFKANNVGELQSFFENRNQCDYIITEYLPDEEYTVDCFTDRHGSLRFCGPRTRKRISNGISVNTESVKGDIALFVDMANQINDAIKFQGAWFFQVKKDVNGEQTLLEIACRLGGSSALHRGLGINFALLTIFDVFGFDVDLISNDYEIELDRALDLKYKINIEYSTIYVDFDDCIIVKDKINSELIAFLYHAFGINKKIILISKNESELEALLKKYRIESLFDEIINIAKDDKKSNYINCSDSIFIDDSFTERKEVFQEKRIPVFAPDMVECLL